MEEVRDECIGFSKRWLGVCNEQMQVGCEREKDKVGYFCF